MAKKVLKFGGTSVGSTKRIKQVSKIIISHIKSKYKVIVVTSAMSGVTNDLIKKSKEISKDFISEEYDVLVSSGEQMSSSLIAGNLNELGYKSRSWLGWQVPIFTAGNHSACRIQSIYKKNILNYLKSGGIPIVTGFQGINSNLRVTTIGRGGTDASAIMLAKFFKAKKCIIYTDVDGVYTSDPRMTENVRRLDKISYEEMIEMASQGAKVLQTASVESAMSNDVDVYVRSTFSPSDKGTLISNDVNNENDRAVTGVAYSKDEAKITLIDVEDKPGVAAEIFNKLAENSVNVDMIVQNNFIERKMTNLTFTIPMIDLDKTLKILENLQKKLKISKVLNEKNLSKVSIIGSGMRNQPGIAAKMFECLSKNKINIEVISTSEIKISVLIDKDKTEKAVNALHAVFQLDQI